MPSHFRSLWLAAALSLLFVALPDAQIKIPNISDIPGVPNIDVIGGVGNAINLVVGAPTKQFILTARGNVGDVYGVPPEMARRLLILGVPEQFVSRARWSNNWRAVDTVFSMDARAMCLQDVIVFRDLQDVYNDVALWVHELKHLEQYDRLGLERFAAEYTVNRQTYENEANNAENSAIAKIDAGALNAVLVPPPPPQRRYYSYCSTPAGNSPTVSGGLPQGSACWMPTPSGPVWGTAVGFFQ